MDFKAILWNMLIRIIELSALPHFLFDDGSGDDRRRWWCGGDGGGGGALLVVVVE